jgi:hypothetical protein
MIAHYVQEGDARLQRFPEYTDNPNVIWDADDVATASPPSPAARATGPPSSGRTAARRRSPGRRCSSTCRARRPARRCASTASAPTAPSTPSASPCCGRGAARHLQRPELPPLRQRRVHGGLHRALPRRPAAGASPTRRAATARRATSATSTLDGAARFPAQGRECTAGDMKVCDPTCAAAWGIADARRGGVRGGVRGRRGPICGARVRPRRRHRFAGRIFRVTFRVSQNVTG